MPRPKGVTVLGALVLLAAVIIALAGIAGFILGFAGLLPGVDLPTSQLFLGGLLYLVIATVLAVAGAGLLSLRPWAWWLAAFAALVALVWQAYGVYKVPTDVPLTSWIALVLTGVILVYLITVYGAFHRHVASVAVPR